MIGPRRTTVGRMLTAFPLVAVCALVGCGPEVDAMSACQPSRIRGVWPHGSAITIVPDPDLFQATHDAAVAWATPMAELGLSFDVEDASATDASTVRRGIPS